MSRIFVYEWCCGGAARGNHPWAASLWPEGWAMLAAVIDDFRKIGGLTLCTLLDAELRSNAVVASKLSEWAEVEIEWVFGDERTAFQTLAEPSEFTLVIAPETDRILESRCRSVVETGARLLGPTPDALALTADKFALARHLLARHVATPPTALANDINWSKLGPSVLKRRRGAGSQDMLVLPIDSRSLDLHLAAIEIGEFVVQPLVPGFAASVAFLIGPRQILAMPATEQFVSATGNFRYRGGRSPIPPPQAERANRIATQAIDAIPGLSGYVGVDVVLGPASDLSTDYVIEVNSRMTASYVGLRQLTDDNLMERLVRLARGEFVCQPQWRDDPLTWSVG